MSNLCPTYVGRKRKHSAQIIKQTHTTTHKHARTSKQTHVPFMSHLRDDYATKSVILNCFWTRANDCKWLSDTGERESRIIQSNGITMGRKCKHSSQTIKQTRMHTNTHAQADKTSNLTHNQTNTQQINMHKQMQSINPAPVQTHTKNQTNTQTNTQTSRHTCSSESSGLMSCAVHVTLGIFGSTSHTRSRRTKKPSHHSSHA